MRKNQYIFAFFSLSRCSRDKYKWRTSRWGACSATCDGGISVRSVRCFDYTNSKWADDRYCIQDDKPINITNCAQQRCPIWRMGSWGQVLSIHPHFTIRARARLIHLTIFCVLCTFPRVCRVQCNADCKRHRLVVCQDDNHNSSISNCPLNIRPGSTATCCNFRWRNLWSPVSLAILVVRSKHSIIIDFCSVR